MIAVHDFLLLCLNGHSITLPLSHFAIHCHTSLYTVTLRYTLSHFTIHCHTSLYSVTLHYTLSHFTIHCHTSLYTVTLHYTLSHFTIHCHTSLYTVTLRYTLPHFAIHCHTLCLPFPHDLIVHGLYNFLCMYINILTLTLTLILCILTYVRTYHPPNAAGCARTVTSSVLVCTMAMDPSPPITTW